jgi:hypothetical protein
MGDSVIAGSWLAIAKNAVEPNLHFPWPCGRPPLFDHDSADHSAQAKHDDFVPLDVFSHLGHLGPTPSPSH